MTTRPDPQLVREIARNAARLAVRRGRDGAVAEAVMEHFWPTVNADNYLPMRAAVTVQYDIEADDLSWPDEQAKAERDVDDMQCQMALELLKMLVAPNRCRRAGDVCEAHGYSTKGSDCPHALARAFLAGAAADVRQMQAGRDAEVRRGVAALLDAVETFRAWLTDAYDPDAPAPDSATAMYQRAAELRAHIAALAELDTREQEGDAQ